MPTVGETVAEMVQYVFPQHAGAPGQMDALEFHAPIGVGDVLILRGALNRVGGRWRSGSRC